MLKDGGPAFPTVPKDIHGYAGDIEGMTLRDYFAAAAMPIFLATKPGPHAENWPMGLDLDGIGGLENCVARGAYLIADAMLAERDK